MYNSQNTMEGLRGQTNVHVNGRYSINRPGSEEDDERTSLLSSDSYTYSQVEDANETPPHPQSSGPSWLTSKRWQVSYFVFLGVLFLYAHRVDLSVSIVCMCNGTRRNFSAGVDRGRAEFSWSGDTKSSLLAAYFYGYLLLQVPGGWLAGKYGATKVVSVAMSLSALCTLLIPVAARNSLSAFYALRVATGLFSGLSAPSFQSLWGRWAPPHERTWLLGFAYSGGYLGTIVTFSLSGVLCDYGFDGGWPSIFYILGGSALLWTLVWSIVVYDSPSSHPTISHQEREYIKNSLQDHSEKSRQVPWRAMFTSAPFWSPVVAVIAMAWVDYTIMTSLPQYLKDILGFDMSEDGVLASAPAICQFVSSLLVGPIADNIRNRGVTTGTVRKIFQTLTFLGRAVSLISVGYVTHEMRPLAIALLGLSGFFAGMQQAGYVANFIDIAPRFSGVMYGVGNGLATVSGIVSPIVVGALTTGKSRAEWQTVFFVCGGFSVLAAIFFVCFAQGQVQPWAMEAIPGQEDTGGDLCYDTIIRPDDENDLLKDKEGKSTKEK